MLEPYAGAVLGKIVVLVVIILFIQKRPRGLFALKGRAVESMITRTLRLDGARPLRSRRHRLIAARPLAVLVPVLNLRAAGRPRRSTSRPIVVRAARQVSLLRAAGALRSISSGAIAASSRLGHGAFFALGGYAMGMYLMRQIGTRGVYGNPVLPDFMVFLNWKELPWFWYGFDHFWFAALMVVLVPGLLAFVFGWLAFRSRVTGVYLSIITQAMTYALLLAFFRNDMGFGGNNGLTDFKDILGFNLQADATRAALFVAIGAGARRSATSSAAAIVALEVRQGAGRGARRRKPHALPRLPRRELQALRLRASRPCMAGIAGALYVPQVGIINPSEFAPANSIEVVIWVAVGGRGTLVGADRSARCSSTSARPGSPARLPEFWLFALGGLFVARHAVPAEGHRRHARGSRARDAPRRRRTAEAPPARRRPQAQAAE